MKATLTQDRVAERTSSSPSAPQSASRPLYIVMAVLVGMVIPVQARINGELSHRLDDGITAATLSFTCGLILMTLAAAFSPRLRQSLRTLGAAARSGRLPLRYLAAGLFGASFALAQSTTALITGVAVFTVSAIAGQTLSGLVVDSVGFGGGIRQRPAGRRLLGAALILVSAVVATLPQLSAAAGPGALLPALVPLVAGFLLGFQQAMNGVSGAVAGSPLAATWMNFFVGAISLGLVWIIKTLIQGPPAEPLPSSGWVYLGGLCGVVFIGASAYLVRRIGVLLLGMGSIAGQLAGSIVLDVALPSGGGSTGVLTVAGAVLTLVAVWIASRRRA
ncbi:DMT family transporter [Streptomyces sp. NPDC051569]|uniref:DMT family transporter n=1 Tax=Streptomyces sp. NPDC051569 TaxID=3365661 RepID=UPI00378B10AD